MPLPDTGIDTCGLFTSDYCWKSLTCACQFSLTPCSDGADDAGFSCAAARTTLLAYERWQYPFFYLGKLWHQLKNKMANSHWYENYHITADWGIQFIKCKDSIVESRKHKHPPRPTNPSPHKSAELQFTTYTRTWQKHDGSRFFFITYIL